MNNASSVDGAVTDEIAPLERLLGYWLRRASTAMMADLGTSLAPAGLRPTEATILILIGDQPGLTQSDIGRILGIARANMAPLMAGLMKQDFIHKARVDGRSQALSLTSAGAIKTAEAHDIITAHEHRFQSRLEPEMTQRLIDALKQLGTTHPAEPI